MDFKVIDINSVISEKELVTVVEDNIRTAAFHREEIRKLKQASKPKKVIPPSKMSEEPKHIFVEPDDFEDEVEYYLLQLNELKLENLEESLVEVLPVRGNKNYKKIVLRLMLESIKTIHEIDEVIEECNPEEDQEEIEMFESEKAFEQRKIELLRACLTEEKEEVIESSTQEQNRLIFVPTTGGSIRVLDEIDKIPEEFYDSFISLFNSIKDGTFKNVKRFTNNNALNGICEVKDPRVRVVFVRLSKNVYAILTAFVKKTQNDKGYSESLRNKVADFRVIADILKSSLENEEFLQMHELYEQELYRKLGVDISDVKTYMKGDK